MSEGLKTSCQAQAAVAAVRGRARVAVQLRALMVHRSRDTRGLGLALGHRMFSNPGICHG